MSFSRWNETRVTVLFDWWHTTNLGEYILSMLAIIVISIVYQGLRNGYIRRLVKSNKMRNDLDSTMDVNIDLAQPLVDKQQEKRGVSFDAVLLGTISYGLGLLLMLVVSVFFPTCIK